MAPFRPHHLMTAALALGGLSALGLGTAHAQSSTFIVTNLSDAASDGACTAANVGDGCTLREAIVLANSNADMTGIVFDSSLSGSVSLRSALPDLSTNLSITDFPGTVAINALGGNYSVLRVANNTNVSLNGLTLANSKATNGGGLFVGASASVALDGCAIVNNAVGQYGGGIYSQSGSVSLRGCDISGNSALYGGGYLAQGGTVTLNQSSLHDNTAGYGGGLFSSNSSTTVSNSAVFNNTATSSFGGGIYNSGGTLTLTNSTLTGNKASNRSGGALFNDVGGTANLTDCTLFGNEAAVYGGGFYNNVGSTVTLGNTIVAGNSAGQGAPDVANQNTLTSKGYNLIGSGDSLATFSQTGDKTGVTSDQLKLGSLQNNGGPTSTLALQSGSIAINAGNTDLTTDQRGVARPQAGADDIGAFEFNAFNESLRVTTLTDEDDGTSDPAYGSGTSLREAINYANSNADQSDITIESSLAGTIALGSELPYLETNLSITDAPGTVAINGQNQDFGVLTVFNAAVTLDGLTLTGGVAYDGGGLSVNNGSATLNGCSIINNRADNYAGGLYAGAQATLTLNNCTVSGNSAQYGAGLFTDYGTTLAMNNCTLASNTADAIGGGFYSRGISTTLGNCTISGNTAGGISGGFFNFSAIALNSCTITGNTGSSGQNGGIETGGSATLTNTIVAANSGTDLDFYDNSGSYVSNGYNLVGASGTNALTAFTKAGDKTGVTAAQLKLGPLQDNGGGIATIALGVGSIAINAGNTDLATDERGVARPFENADDVGAYESQVATSVTVKGRVYNAVALAGLPGMVVNAVRQSDGKAFAVGTDSTGNYSLKLPLGTYTFAALFPHKPGFIIYPAFANPVTFTGSPTPLPSYDFRAVGITGRIISPANVGISGVTLNLYAQNDTGFKTALRTAKSDSNGFFSLDGVSAGTYLVVPVAPTTYTYTPTTRIVTVVNKAVFTSFTASVKSKPKTVGGARSSALLSSASANAQAGTLTLKFTSSLDAASAQDAIHYGVTVNGAALSVEDAVLRSGDTVVLSLPQGAFTSGSHVNATWSGVLDAQGLALEGTAQITAP